MFLAHLALQVWAGLQASRPGALSDLYGVVGASEVLGRSAVAMETQILLEVKTD